MRHLDAIIFDVDGTLADTEEMHRQAFNRAFREFDLDWDWTPALYEELLTVSGGRERIRYYGQDLAERFSHQDELLRFVRDVHRVKTGIYGEMLVEGRLPLRPGIERLIGEARQAGIKLAIATSSAFSNAKTLLDNNLPADWMSWFTAIETCDSVPQKKPSPAVYQAVLGKLGVALERVIAVEDTQNGLAAATAAGLTTIVTTHFFTRNHHFPHAALVVDSIGEPGDPFTVAHGDVGEHQYVDLELIDRLLKLQKLDTDTETWAEPQAVCA